MNSTMFLADLTCLDHSFIIPGGFSTTGLTSEFPILVGGSYMVSCYVSGPVDEYENVVVDFSNIKKFLKSEIDCFERGYDHKMLMLAGTPGVEVTPLEGHQVAITMPGMRIELPAVRVTEFRSVEFKDLHKFTSLKDAFEYELGVYITNRAQIAYEKDVKVKVCLSPNMPFIKSFSMSRNKSEFNTCTVFNYIHGLHRSSSVGCRNIAHGHQSVVYSASDKPTPEFRARMEALLKGSVVFVSEDTYLRQDAQTGVVEYGVSGPHGQEHFKMTISTVKGEHLYNVLVLPRETTVENIAEFLARDAAWSGFTGTLAVSEGLTKGAVIDVEADK